MAERSDGLWVVMTRGPHPDGEFVELEDQDGCGVGPSSGVNWRQEDGYWLLGPFVPAALVAGVQEALDWAKAPTTDDALEGVERRVGMEQGYSLAGRIRALFSRERIEGNRQRERVEAAEREREAQAAEISVRQSELDDIALLVGLPVDASHGAVREKVAEAVNAADQLRLA